ncbi:efflux RND transporter periplasmic adaptor subunit [Pedobacter antarcticus]|uniref:ABC transporter permease n=2 Tax=Pedobacter antarcticus TaxID=34086 RepID=A0A081PEY7_9SPHI|nr:HlyD family efflux transporter periplasmic adaptor subunit [Pedobacter antarcticus]KEQ29260.1 ABC transporter permease [Pedobacter antarcticus 4BY]SDM62770.1 HlyD family secretion protein [Pedobacter antarcticus]SFF35822.1 HlyD family secretion protein [Pedobacter antarcticus]
MDRPLPSAILASEKRKWWTISFLMALVLLLAIWFLRQVFRSELSASKISTAMVERGSVTNTINATGEVLPEFEEVLSSPIAASVQRVLLDAGQKVNAGQSILTLDKSSITTEYEKLQFLIESKENEIHKLRLDLEKSYFDIKSSNQIKQLRISNLTDMVTGAKRLYKAGGGTMEDIEQAELNLKVAQLEKKQLENEISSKQKTMKIELREAELALAIQRNEVSALKRKMGQADIVASRTGVVTWVNQNIGASIQQGEALARIADLSSFKVAGSVSDVQLENLHTNMPAVIRIGEKQLKGKVINISPSVKNGIVSFDVRLEEHDNSLLRPNMKVEIFLITAVHEKTMRITNGAAFNGSNLQDVFVVTKGKAVRTKIKTGLSNFDYIEVLNGLNVGDQVIVSDMNTYKNQSEIVISP